MPPKGSKKGAEAKKGNTPKAAKNNTNQAEEGEQEKEQEKEQEEEQEAEQEQEGEEETDDTEKALNTTDRQQLRNTFDARIKALSRLPKGGSKGDKKRQLLFDRATDIIQNGRLKSNPCRNCEAAGKECFVAPSAWRGELGPGKCAFCVWGGTPCSVSLFRALGPIDS
jgi:hypothetical protein